MEKIKDFIHSRKLKIASSTRAVNTTWEIATEFAHYLGLNTIFVLKLFKNYGQQNVLSLRSYMKDFPDKGKFKTKNGLIVWKLEQLKNDTKKTP